jgi:hypothetical protein
MMQPRQRPALAVETIQQMRVGDAAELDRLDNDDAVQLVLLGLVELAHAAHGEDPTDLVLP